MNGASGRTVSIRRAIVGVAVIGFVGVGMIAGIAVAQAAATHVTASQTQPRSVPTATPTTTINGGSAFFQPPISQRKPLAAGWVVLAVAAACVIALGLYRVPDRVLQSAGPACRLEES
jgi:hypothetical protein